MILEPFLDGLYAVLYFLIDLLPIINFLDFSEGLLGFAELICLGSIFIDIEVFIRCLSIWLFVYNIELTWSVIEWLYKKIPGIN